MQVNLDKKNKQNQNLFQLPSSKKTVGCDMKLNKKIMHLLRSYETQPLDIWATISSDFQHFLGSCWKGKRKKIESSSQGKKTQHGQTQHFMTALPVQERSHGDLSTDKHEQTP